MSNQLSLEDAVPSRLLTSLVMRTIFVLVGLVLLRFVGHASLVSIPAGVFLFVLYLAMMFRLLRKLPEMPTVRFRTAMLWLCRQMGEQYQQWWYRNVLGCYAFYGLDIYDAMTIRYGRNIEKVKDGLLEFRNNFVVWAVHLGGWWRPRRVIEIRRMTLSPTWWRMKRANTEGTRLRIDDLGTGSGERGRIYTHVDTFFAAIQARYLHSAVRAGTWHNSLLAWLLPAKQQRDALESLVFRMIKQIKDSTRYSHSDQARDIRLGTLRDLKGILPSDHLIHSQIDEQIAEIEARIAKAEEQKSAKGRKGSGVTVRKEAKGQTKVGVTTRGGIRQESW